jgi:hypothetical protein
MYAAASRPEDGLNPAGQARAPTLAGACQAS